MLSHVCLTMSMLPSRAALLRNTDPHAVFVVAGASRGIGLAMVRELLGRTRGRDAIEPKDRRQDASPESTGARPTTRVTTVRRGRLRFRRI